MPKLDKITNEGILNIYIGMTPEERIKEMEILETSILHYSFLNLEDCMWGEGVIKNYSRKCAGARDPLIESYCRRLKLLSEIM